MASEREKSSAPPPSAPPTAVAKAANGAAHTGEMEQVRELLFGETKRSTEKALKALESRIEEMTATMNARFTEVMGLIADVQNNAEKAQATTIDEIGAAISQLSTNIRNVSAARKPK